MGYKWTIADDILLRFHGADVPFDRIYSFDGLAVFLRSNMWANKFANYDGQWTNGELFVDELITSLDSWMGHEDGYVIIALDGETFGHHHPTLNEAFLIDLFTALSEAGDRLQTAHLSDLLQKFPQEPHFLPPGSWSTDAADVGNLDYFAWWHSRHNSIHQLQWQLTNLILRKVRSIADDELNMEMDKALYSCQYWWASCWKFAPPEIYKGAFNMMRILHRAADLTGDEDHHLSEAEELFRHLVTEVEKKQHGWEG